MNKFDLTYKEHQFLNRIVAYVYSYTIFYSDLYYFGEKTNMSKNEIETAIEKFKSYELIEITDIKIINIGKNYEEYNKF